MTFSDFIQELGIKSHTAGIIKIDDHRDNFAKMFLLNKMTGLLDSAGTRQTGKTTHNILMSLYNKVKCDQRSLLVVQNTQEKERILMDLKSFSNQLNLRSIDNIDTFSLNTLSNKSMLRGRSKYDHIFIDSVIVEKFNSFSVGRKYDKGNDYYIGMCRDLTTAIYQLQGTHKLKSLNCLSKSNEETIITSDKITFSKGDLFIISPDKNNASTVGTILNLNYNSEVPWASTVDLLLDGSMSTMPYHNVEYFTKL